MGESARQPWEVILRCSDCGAEFRVADRLVDYTVDVIEHPSGERQRMLMIRWLADCPACHNIRVAPGS